MGFTITYNAKYILDIFNFIAGIWNGLVYVNDFFTSTGSVANYDICGRLECPQHRSQCRHHYHKIRQ